MYTYTSGFTGVEFNQLIHQVALKKMLERLMKLLGYVVQLKVDGNEIVVYHHVVHPLSCTQKYPVNCHESTCVPQETITLHKFIHEFNHREFPVIAIL